MTSIKTKFPFLLFQIPCKCVVMLPRGAIELLETCRINILQLGRWPSAVCACRPTCRDCTYFYSNIECIDFFFIFRKVWPLSLFCASQVLLMIFFEKAWLRISFIIVFFLRWIKINKLFCTSLIWFAVCLNLRQSGLRWGTSQFLFGLRSILGFACSSLKHKFLKNFAYEI